MICLFCSHFQSSKCYTWRLVTLSSPLHHHLFLQCLRSAFRSFLCTRAVRGCHHVRTLHFLPLLPTIEFICISAFSSLVMVEDSEGVLSEFNLSAYKMGQTEAVSRVEGCSQTAVIRLGRIQEINALISLTFFLFSCWCFPLTEPSWKLEGQEAHPSNPFDVNLPGERAEERSWRVDPEGQKKISSPSSFLRAGNWEGPSSILHFSEMWSPGHAQSSNQSVCGGQESREDWTRTLVPHSFVRQVLWLEKSSDIP